MHMFSQRVFAIMVFLTATVIFSASASPVAPPSPLPEDVPPGLAILKRTATPDNGTLTWYGQALNATYKNTTTVENPNILNADCRNDILEPTCRDDFAASRDACLFVLSRLTGDPFEWDKRSVCMMDDKGDRCCISWQDGVSGGDQSTLKQAAYKLLYNNGNNCVFLRDGKYMVSGLTRNTRVGLARHCTVQCLSNRPDGCA